jgi:hypothetical protein
LDSQNPAINYHGKGEEMKYLASALACVLVILVMAAGVCAQYDSTATIYLVQQETYPIGYNVYVDSVIVTALDLKPTTFGFHAQEIPGGAYSGVLCYMSYDVPTVQVGDMVEVWGYYDEYNNHTEIQVDSVAVIQAGWGELDCELLSAKHFLQYPDTSMCGEEWEGVLVCVDTVQVAGIQDYAEWQVVEYHDHTDGCWDDSVRIDDKLFDPTLAPPDSGDTLAFIQGVVAEEYGTYKIWPRDSDDLIFMGPTPGPHVLLAYATSDTTINVIFDRPLNEASAEDINNYDLATLTPINNAILNLGNMKTVRLLTDVPPSNTLEILTVCDVQSDGGTPMFECETYEFMGGITDIAHVQGPAHGGTDSSQIESRQVTVRGIVTSGSESFGGPYFIQDGDGPWNGVYIYQPGGNFDLGDSVVVSGVVQEYYNWTEIISIDYTREDADQVRIPTPYVIGGTDLCSAGVEAYESILATMDSADVVSPYPDGVGEWVVAYAPCSVAVGDFVNDVPGEPSYSFEYFWDMIELTGCIRYHYGEMKIEPRFAADIVVIDSVAAGIDDDPYALRLYPNAPNPFASGTTIKFSVPSKMRARIAVYDVAGRLVNVVTDGQVEPGIHHITWNGRDRHGATVSSGIYFYQLTTPRGVMMNKMVRLK